MIKDIKKFCEKFGACAGGREWALKNCKDMREVWKKAEPEWLIWVATRKGVLTDKQLRLFAVWCCRRIWPLLTDERSRNAVIVAEKYANGKATKEELNAAAYAAYAAYAASAAAYAASATSAAYSAYAAAAAAYAAAAAVYAASAASTKEAQASYLRKKYHPFGK